MRTILAFLFLAAGCGGGGLGTDDKKDMRAPTPDLTVPVPDLTVHDLRPPPDLMPKVIDAAGINCGMKVCDNKKGEICCGKIVDGGMFPELMCAKSCTSDGGIPITCDGPEDCPNNAKVCCADFAVGSGQAPFCPIQSAAASCKASCDLEIPMQCPGMGRGRLCHQSADCAGTATKACCEYMGLSACLPEMFMGVSVRMFLKCD